MKSLCVTTQIKAIEQYFPVVLFIMLYKVVLTFESVDKIVKCEGTVVLQSLKLWHSISLLCCLGLLVATSICRHQV